MERSGIRDMVRFGTTIPDSGAARLHPGYVNGKAEKMMRCTSCNTGVLRPSFMDALFRAHTCSSCGGNWVLIQDYVTWKEHHPEHSFPEDLTAFDESEARDSKQAMLCPVSGAIMQKFRISAGNEHRLDYSAAVGGLWLDKGEWELLKAEGLAGSLNAVVTQQWQHKIRQDSARENFAEIYRQKFGEDLYDKLKDVREWLQSQEQKADIRAYLLAEDPYSAEK